MNLRIIKRTNPINNSVLYVLQHETYANQYQNALGSNILPSASRWQDISLHAKLEEAKEAKYKLKNNLGIGEELVE